MPEVSDVWKKDELTSSTGILVALRASVAGMRWKGGFWGEWDSEERCHTVGCVRDLAHELGHFHAASLRRRQIPHWGLGHPGSIAPREPLPARGYLVSARRADVEEWRASLFGISLLIEVGAPELAAYDLQEHGWVDDHTDHRMVLVLAGLVRRGLILPRTPETIRDILGDRTLWDSASAREIVFSA